jgi:hypothetical protein
MTLPETGTETTDKRRSMQEFGTLFIADLPKHIQSLHIPSRKISDNFTGAASLDYDVDNGPLLLVILAHGRICQAEFCLLFGW